MDGSDIQGMLEVAKQIFRRQDPNADFTFLDPFEINPHLATVVWDPNTPGVRQKEIRFYLSRQDHVWGRLVVTLPAILQYLRANTNLPVPQCIQVDRTDTNPIARSYLALSETPDGNRVNQVLHQLNSEQRLDLAANLGTLLGDLVSQGVECDEAGILVHRTAPVPGQPNPAYELIPLPDAGNFDSITSPRANLSSLRTHFNICQPDAAYAWFEQCFNSQIRFHEANAHQGNASWIRQFLAMAGELSSRGWLKGIRFTYVDQALVHPERYFVRYTNKQGVQDDRPDAVTITHVTIGHEGVLAPSFIACRAPAWLWGEDIEGRYNQDTTYSTDGLDASQKSVRDRFYITAGGKYSRFSCHRVYQLACTLGWFAINGFATRTNRTTTDIEEATRMLRDWNSIKNSDEFPPPLQDAEE